MALAPSDLVAQELPEDPLVEEPGERVPDGVVFDVLGVLVDRLHRPHHVQDARDDALHHQDLDRVLRRGVMEPHPHNPPYLGGFEKEALGRQRQGFGREGGKREGRIRDIMADGKVLRRGKALECSHLLDGEPLEKELGLFGRLAFPEDLDLVVPVPGEKDGKEKKDLDDGIDVVEHVLHMLLPVVDNLGGDDEAFEKADLEGEHRDIRCGPLQRRDHPQRVPEAVRKLRKMLAPHLSLPRQKNVEGADRRREQVAKRPGVVRLLHPVRGLRQHLPRPRDHRGLPQRLLENPSHPGGNLPPHGQKGVVPPRYS